MMVSCRVGLTPTKFTSSLQGSVALVPFRAMVILGGYLLSSWYCFSKSTSYCQKLTSSSSIYGAHVSFMAISTDA